MGEGVVFVEVPGDFVGDPPLVAVVLTTGDGCASVEFCWLTTFSPSLEDVDELVEFSALFDTLTCGKFVLVVLIKPHTISGTLNKISIIGVVATISFNGGGLH